MEWIGISDRFPENSFDYHYIVTDGKRMFMAFRYYNRWYIHGDYMMDEITHWMPLPEPPKQ